MKTARTSKRKVVVKKKARKGTDASGVLRRSPMLRRLVEVRRKVGNEQGFYDVLSALRGPDFPFGDDVAPGVSTGAAKQAATAVIRHHALGESFFFGVSRADNEVARDVRLKLVRRGGEHFAGEHFAAHARDAFEALGLKWDEVNR